MNSDPFKQLAEQSQAVALYYDGEHAPTVTASGIGAVAEELLEIAREHGIPIYENPQLAEVLTRLELGEEIPEHLYRMVAEIIAFVFYLQGLTPEDIESRKKK